MVSTETSSIIMKMKASQNNDLCHEEGIPMEEMAARYSSWAKQYELDLCEENYHGPIIVATRLCELFPDTSSRAKLRVIDLAAGTGLVGEKLKPMGFQNVDALEPSEGMLSVLEGKKVYKNTFSEFLDGSTLSIAKDTYDVALIAGGMGEGHIPCQGLDDLPRIVKPGGYVVIAMREAYLQTVAEYKDRLEPHMDKMASKGAWTKVARTIIPKYSFDNKGILYTFRV